MKVRDIMTADPVVVSKDMPVKEAARILAEKRVGALPVVEGYGLLGIITESDLIMKDIQLEYPSYFQFIDAYIVSPKKVEEFEQQLRKAVAATVGDLMTAPPITIGPDASVDEAATELVKHGIDQLLVVDDSHLIGIVSKFDVIDSMLREDGGEE